MKFILSSLPILVLYTNVSFAQIPVTDGASIANDAMHHMETILQWKEQYDQMVEQIQNLRATVEQTQRTASALTSMNNLGQIFNDPRLRDYLPTDWQDIYDLVKQGGYSGLTGDALDIFNANNVFDACANILPDDERIACEAMAVKPAQDKAFALEAYDAARSRIDQIDELMNEINNTSDAKAVAELQARIASEQVMINNEQTKLQLYAMVAEAEDRMQKQKQREFNARTWASREGIQIQPLSF